MISGIINVYKEAGFTSHDVVAKMRGIFKQKKIGHTGTLDPDATGVLPVCLGKATKVCDLLTEKDKTYRCTMLLGVKTDTQDISGQILEEHEVNVSVDKVLDVIMEFVGEYEQIPPMYSALKVNGKKLYELAREGKEVERKPRTVRIEEIKIEQVYLPRIIMEVTCSKGTYIRTLCYDIGEKLGCGACMEQLIRTRVASFDIKESKTLTQLEEIIKNGKIQEILLPVDQLFPQYPTVTVKEEFINILENGNRIPVEGLLKWNTEWENLSLRVYDNKDRFAGIYKYQSDRKDIKPIKIFLEKD